jgi:hypothetical protein
MTQAQSGDVRLERGRLNMASATPEASGNSREITPGQTTAKQPASP